MVSLSHFTDEAIQNSFLSQDIWLVNGSLRDVKIKKVEEE